MDPDGEGVMEAQFYELSFEQWMRIGNTCWNCKHFSTRQYVPEKFNPYSARIQGECRKNAPGSDGFPEVMDYHTCGEFDRPSLSQTMPPGAS